MKNKKLIYILLLLIVVGAVSFFLYLNQNSSIQQIKYESFEKMVKNHEIKNVNIDGERLIVTNKKNKEFITVNPDSNDFKLFLLTNGVSNVSTKINIYSFIPFIMTYGLLFLILGYLVITKISDKKKNMDTKEDINKNITFEMVGGLSDAKKQLLVIKDYLNNPNKYIDNNINFPKGVLLYGPPGCGKTMLAKALANETNLPFYSINCSSLENKYVGVGSKKLVSIFQQARENSPCILFIDEIDGLGSRMESDSCYHQTITTLLTELDGVSNKSEKLVFVVATTNLIKNVDPALRRAGRLSYHIKISRPQSLEDMISVAKVHFEGKKISKDINLSYLCRLLLLLKLSSADVMKLINDAAIISVTKKNPVISYKDIIISLNKGIKNNQIHLNLFQKVYYNYFKITTVHMFI